MNANRHRTLYGGLAALLTLLGATPARAQNADVGGTGIQVETNLNRVVTEGSAVRVSFGRALDTSERAAVFIGDTDVTALFEQTRTGLEYAEGSLPLLSRGTQDLAVYLVHPGGDWVEIHRQTVQVGDGLGFTAHEVDPSITVEYSRTLDQGMDPDDGFEQDLRAELRGSINLRTRHARESSEYSTEAMVLGVEDRQNALRFGELQAGAPKYDLSSYRFAGTNGPVAFALGHVSAGDQRHLVSGISSRGATLRVGEGRRLSASVAAMGGSNIVGWDNLVGLGDADHRMITGAVALDAFATPGKLRVKLHGLTGSVLPQIGFNSGEIVDAETSQGLGGSLNGSFLDRRVRFDLGLAQSTFDNPVDPLLDQGFDIVPVVEETNYARYAEASLDLIRNWQIGETRSARLTLGARHENVDPLYRSLGAYTPSDQRSHGFDVQADVGGIGFQGSLGSSRNNLNDIASILTTRTRTGNANLRLPLAQVAQSQSSWLPSISAQLARTHQMGLNDPVDGGFSPSHIPDQVSISQSASVDWQFSRLSLGYRWTRSDQDNRQEGRQDADFEVITNGLNLSLNPIPRVSASADLGLEESINHELEETDETLRFGGSVSVQVFARSTLSFQYSDTNTEDLARIRSQQNSNLNLAWSSYVPDLGPLTGQYFLRFSRSENRFADLSFQSDDRRSNWTLDLGANFSFF